MALNNRNVLISGASAAGPSLAYWLRHHGFNPTVVERHPTLRPGGYAIDVRGTAVKVAELMGILPEIRKADTQLKQFLFVDSKGKEVASMEPNFGAGPGKAGDVELLRDDLAVILYGATKHNVEYIFNDSITSIKEQGNGVDVTFQRSPPRSFDLVVGCDGAHSNVRRLVFGNEAQFSHYLGSYISVFTVPNYLNLDRVWVWHYRPKKIAGLMQYGLGKHTRAIFIYSAPKVPFDHHNLEEQRALVRKTFAEDKDWEIPRLLDEMDKATDFYFDDCSQIRMNGWSKGRVTLLGDACYAPTPLSGQGTSLAMVGAYTLAGELAAARGDYRVAFARYEQECRPWVEQNQRIPEVVEETRIPQTAEEVEEQLAKLRAVKAAPLGEPPEGSAPDVIQVAANAFTLKPYERAVA